MRFYEIYILRILTLVLLIKGGVLRRNPGNAFVSVIYIYIYLRILINQSITNPLINYFMYF